MNIPNLIQNTSRKVVDIITMSPSKLFKKLKITSSAMLYIRVFALLYFLVNLVYIIFWLLLAILYDNVNLPELRQYIVALSSAGVVAIVGFFTQSLADKNDNGIPDNIEKSDTTADNDKSPK